MDFSITKIVTKQHSRFKWMAMLYQFILVPTLLLLFVVFVIPVLLIVHFLSKKEKKETIIDEKFIKIFESGNLIIERKSLDYFNHENEDLNLDFSWNDYAFKLRTIPKIEEIEHPIFDLNFFETDIGFFIISVNSAPNGMVLWFLNKHRLEFKKINDLISSDWNFKQENGKTILYTYTDHEKITMLIENLDS